MSFSSRDSEEAMKCTAIADAQSAKTNSKGKPLEGNGAEEDSFNGSPRIATSCSAYGNRAIGRS